MLETSNSNPVTLPLPLFNPWNDLALAANDPHYTPPASAMQMADDLCDLSHWWQDRGVLPWGWSPLMVRLLREAGVSEDCLPTAQQMADFRAFASRQTAIRLLHQLRATWSEPFRSGSLVGESVWCESEAEVLSAIAADGSRVMLKAPWSGSGRGVNPVTGQLSEKDVSWIRRILQRQGGVEVEPLYNKVQDFAMEFWAEGGRVRYEGLSLFSTTEGGVYRGNLVASEAEKERRLSASVSLSLLHDLRHHLEELLTSAGFPAWYTGPLGIDMMSVEFQDSSFKFQDSSFKFQVHPFVEMNLRITMGWVALQMQRKMQENETATFVLGKKDGRYCATLTKND